MWAICIGFMTVHTAYAMKTDLGRFKRDGILRLVYSSNMLWNLWTSDNCSLFVIIVLNSISNILYSSYFQLNWGKVMSGNFILQLYIILNGEFLIILISELKWLKLTSIALLWAHLIRAVTFLFLHILIFWNFA